MQQRISLITQRQRPSVAIPADRRRRFSGSETLQQSDAVDRQRLILRTLVNDGCWTRIFVWNDIESTKVHIGTDFSYASFYRAMLCLAQTMLSQDVCPSVRPSVCLSVTRRYSIKQLNISSNAFYHRVATSFWFFFRTKRYSNIPTKTP